MRMKPDSPMPFDCISMIGSLAGDALITRLMALGNINLLQNPTLALFCSARCPGGLIFRFYDAIHKLRYERQTIISGFHSPIEREALPTLMKGQGDVVICPARSIDKMRIPSAWRQALRDKRL